MLHCNFQIFFITKTLLRRQMESSVNFSLCYRLELETVPQKASSYFLGLWKKVQIWLWWRLSNLLSL